MDIQELLRKSRAIWGEQKLSLSQIIVRMGKVFGDICRWERNAPKDATKHTDEELKKELGNIYSVQFSGATIWAMTRKSALD